MIGTARIGDVVQFLINILVRPLERHSSLLFYYYNIIPNSFNPFPKPIRAKYALSSKIVISVFLLEHLDFLIRILLSHTDHMSLEKSNDLGQYFLGIMFAQTLPSLDAMPDGNTDFV